MKFKKMSAVVLAATMTAGLLGGCGSSADTTTESTTEVQTTAETQAAAETTAETTADTTAEATTIEPCTISFWHAMTGTQEEELQALTDKFNSENEYGITVELTNQGYYSDLSTKLTANAAADTLPDMAQAYNNWVVPYVDKVVHLDDFVANDFDNWDDIVEGYRDEVSQFGFISGIPFNKSTYVFFYNKTMFEELGLEAPETWEDLEHIGEVVLEEKGFAAFGYDDLAGMLEAYIRQAGSDYVAADGALFDNEQGLEAVTEIMKLYNNGYARLVGEDSYFSTPMSNQMIAGYIGSSTGVTYIDTSSGFELGTCPLPSGTVAAANQAGTNLVMFAQDENKQKAVWEYMKYLTTVEATTEWAMTTGYLPVRTSAYESAEYQEFMAGNETAQAAYAQSDAFFTSVTFDGSYDIMQTMGDVLEEEILNGSDAQTVFDRLVEECNSLVQ